MKPLATDHPEYFTKYINLVPEDEILTAFKTQLPLVTARLGSISEKNAAYSYAPGKWTIKELLQHIIDTERMFMFRSLAIARKETAVLPSFDENAYASASDANRRTWNELINEFITLRQSTTNLFESFTPSMINQSGKAASGNTTVNSLGFIIAGHVYHHLNVIKEKYNM